VGGSPRAELVEGFEMARVEEVVTVRMMSEERGVLVALVNQVRMV